MDDGRVMAPMDLQLRFLSAQIVYGLLGLEDRRGRLDDALDEDRHAVGNAAVDAAIVIGQRTDAAAIAESVIGLGAIKLRKAKAQSELYAFDGRNTEQQMAEDAFDRVKEWFADPGRKAADRSFKDPADAVFCFLRPQ